MFKVQQNLKYSSSTNIEGVILYLPCTWLVSTNVLDKLFCFSKLPTDSN